MSIPHRTHSHSMEKDNVTSTASQPEKHGTTEPYVALTQTYDPKADQNETWELKETPNGISQPETAPSNKTPEKNPELGTNLDDEEYTQQKYRMVPDSQMIQSVIAGPDILSETKGTRPIHSEILEPKANQERAVTSLLHNRTTHVNETPTEIKVKSIKSQKNPAEILETEIDIDRAFESMNGYETLEPQATSAESPNLKTTSDGTEYETNRSRTLQLKATSTETSEPTTEFEIQGPKETSLETPEPKVVPPEASASKITTDSKTSEDIPETSPTLMTPDKMIAVPPGTLTPSPSPQVFVHDKDVRSKTYMPRKTGKLGYFWYICW